MADTTSDDVYDDPDNMLADTDDSVDGAVELPKYQTEDLSQSIFVPEREGPDERGSLDVTSPDQEGPDANDEGASESLEEIRQSGDRDDIDADHLSDVIPPETKDGSGD